MPILKNKRHEHFATLVGTHGVKPETAYITAGYSPNGAAAGCYKLQKRNDVLQRIAELTAIKAERVAEKTGVDRAWVIEQLVENVKMAKAAIPVKSKEGEEIGEYKQELSAANKALELIGKEIGMFVDRKEIRTGPLDAADHEELGALSEALAQLAGLSSQAVSTDARSTRH